MCTKSLNFRHCHHGNLSNAKLPKNILVTAEHNIFFSVFLCYPFVIYLIWYRKKYLRIDIHIYKFRQRKLKELPRRNNSETQATLDTRHRMNTKNKQTKTRGTVGWACVAHLSFCFEKTLYRTFHRCFLPCQISVHLAARFQRRRFFWNNQKK